MNIRHLEVVRAILRTGSVTDAARILGISQPAASKLLREAETQLGGRLFDRHGRRLRERPEAATLADAVEDVFVHIERVRVLAEQLDNPSDVPVRIGAFPAAAMTALPAAIAAFRSVQPDARVETYALLTRQIVEQVAMGSLDIGFVYSSKENSAVRAIDLPPSRIVCAMRPDHPLSALARITPHDLADHAFISFHLDESISLTIREGFRAAGAHCRPAILVNHSYTACALAEQGVGVALVTPSLFASGLFPGLVVRPLTPDFVMRPQLLCPRARPLRPEADTMIGCLRDAVEAQAARTDPALRADGDHVT